ncbi:MAG: hypothetical protein IJQ00_00590 [Kiritimatiellae bacterium]|nr:hypothetical protein [Kiritimatiellia bacterium]
MTAHETIEMIRNADFGGMTLSEVYEFGKIAHPLWAKKHTENGNFADMWGDEAALRDARDDMKWIRERMEFFLGQGMSEEKALEEAQNCL